MLQLLGITVVVFTIAGLLIWAEWRHKRKLKEF